MFKVKYKYSPERPETVYAVHKTDSGRAEWICTIGCDPVEDCAARDCRECVLEWLRQEAT